MERAQIFCSQVSDKTVMQEPLHSKTTVKKFSPTQTSWATAKNSSKQTTRLQLTTLLTPLRETLAQSKITPSSISISHSRRGSICMGFKVLLRPMLAIIVTHTARLRDRVITLRIRQTFWNRALKTIKTWWSWPTTKVECHLPWTMHTSLSMVQLSQSSPRPSALPRPNLVKRCKAQLPTLREKTLDF